MRYLTGDPPDLAERAAARRRGWQVVYLGADAPAEDVLQAAEQLCHRGIVVSCMVVDPASAWGSYRSPCLRLAPKEAG